LKPNPHAPTDRFGLALDFLTSLPIEWILWLVIESLLAAFYRLILTHFNLKNRHTASSRGPSLREGRGSSFCKTHATVR
jgi:hypothetical protein